MATVTFGVKFVLNPRRILLSAALGLLPGATVEAQDIWRLDSSARIGGHVVEVIGSPKVRVDTETREAAVAFDGAADGLIIPAIPFAGAKAFTIEIYFQPLEGGLTEQRFFHAEDTKGARAMIETRLDGKGGWWLDTYIGGRGPGGVALIDPTKVHRTGAWYWAALVYDGRTLAHFVDGVKELEREGKFQPFGDGRISLGVRQNRVYWFKGAIAEVRFHAAALPAEQLQRRGR